MATKKKAFNEEAKEPEATPQPIEPTTGQFDNENEPYGEPAEAPEVKPFEQQPDQAEAPEEKTDETPDVTTEEVEQPASESTDVKTSNKEPSSDADGQTEEATPANTPKVAIVIPYLKRKAQGKELLHAIRSIAKNFAHDDYMLVIIGDKEDWFGDEILHLDHTCIGDNPQADVIDKMKQILADERIPEGFIWSNDDIYFVAPTTLEDIQVLKVAGNLVDDGSVTLYNRNRIRTINLLKKHGCPIRNFATHMPVFFLKEKMVEVFEGIPEMNSQGLLMSSLYFNLQYPKAPVVTHDWKKDKWALRVVSKLATEEKKQAFRDLIKTKHFLNHSENGYSAILMDWIGRQFPEKSRFEK